MNEKVTSITPGISKKLKRAPQIALIDELAWQRNKNQAATEEVEYAERWARLMQWYMQRGEKLEDIAESALKEVQEELVMRYLREGSRYNAIDFINTCAFLALYVHWKYGEELKKWHTGTRDKYFQWMWAEKDVVLSKNLNILKLFGKI